MAPRREECSKALKLNAVQELLVSENGFMTSVVHARNLCNLDEIIAVTDPPQQTSSSPALLSLTVCVQTQLALLHGFYTCFESGAPRPQASDGESSRSRELPRDQSILLTHCDYGPEIEHDASGGGEGLSGNECPNAKWGTLFQVMARALAVGGP